MKAKTFEGRMAFFILISVMVTGATEYLTFHLIRVVSEYLRENGYRSSAIGCDGVDPGTRIGMMIFVGILVFVITFSLQLHFYIRYLRTITAGSSGLQMEILMWRSRCGGRMVCPHGKKSEPDAGECQSHYGERTDRRACQP